MPEEHVAHEEEGQELRLHETTPIEVENGGLIATPPRTGSMFAEESTMLRALKAEQQRGPMLLIVHDQGAVLSSRTRWRHCEALRTV